MIKKHKGIQCPLDIAKARRLCGTLENATAMIESFIEGLGVEKTELEGAYFYGDWVLIKNKVHRIRGGAIYCGAVILEEACAELENCLMNSSSEKKEILYKKVMFAMTVLEEYFKCCLQPML